MQILGIYGGQDASGLTATVVKEILGAVQAPATTAFLDLNEFDLHPESPQRPNPDLDQLAAKLQAADIWVFGAPTYYTTIPGQLKQFFDVMRHRWTRMTKNGDSLPNGTFQDKHYVLVTSCFAPTWDNLFTGQTDLTLRAIDGAMTLAGVHKITELVCPNTWRQRTPTVKKLARARAIGRQLSHYQRKDDETLKRYGLLFCMIAVMALATMGIQQLWPALTNGFWLRYVSFVVIFFVLLAIILHVMTFMRHKRA